MTNPFEGAWRRRSLTIDGRGRDDADVLWLQAGGWYADLRIPHDDHRGPVEAFAGPVTWVEPRFTWIHDIDWLGTFPDDVGHLERVGEQWRDGVIERGVTIDAGVEVAYEERWERIDPIGRVFAAVGARPGERSCVVEAGGHRLAMVDGRGAGGGFGVRREHLVDGTATVAFERIIGALPGGSLSVTFDRGRAGEVLLGDRVMDTVRRLDFR